ncbi:MAG: DUF2608 domain-containing protein [Candidatus Babeliales bacterium]
MKDIISTKSIKDVLNYITSQKDFILFDIDKTLIVPKEIESFESVIAQKLINEGNIDLHTLTSAPEKIFVELLETQSISVKPVEQETPLVVHEIQKQGNPTIAITSRFPSLASYTLEQLHSVDINFAQSQLAHENIILKTNNCYFKDGILFCGMQNNKSNLLLELLNQSSIKPTKIIYIDDEILHLLSMQKMLISSAITFQGIHYTRIPTSPAEKQLKELYLSFIKNN